MHERAVAAGLRRAEAAVLCRAESLLAGPVAEVRDVGGSDRAGRALDPDGGRARRGPKLKRFDWRGIESFELFRSEFGQNSLKREIQNFGN